MIKEITKTIKSIAGLHEGSEEVIISFTDGTEIVQNHDQNCCEEVSVSQVDGDIKRHLNAELYTIEEKTQDMGDAADETGTWTFYTMVTSRGYLDWRWQGESNGYYSESVDCHFNGKFMEL